LPGQEKIYSRVNANEFDLPAYTHVLRFAFLLKLVIL